MVITAQLRNKISDLKKKIVSPREFGEFCQLFANFLVEDPDMETMKRELRELMDPFRYEKN